MTHPTCCSSAGDLRHEAAWQLSTDRGWLFAEHLNHLLLFNYVLGNCFEVWHLSGAVALSVMFVFKFLSSIP
jgi:hypothetical protein